MKIDRKYFDDCTISRVTYKDFQCWFLELPWKDNAPFISCIPEGKYVVQRRFSPSKQEEVFEYLLVPERTHVQIHVGNFTSQIQGCQLPGDSIKWLNKDGIPDVTNSRTVFKKLLQILPSEFEVEITS